MKQKKTQGFTLIELSFVLAIMGSVVAITTSWKKKQTDVQAYTETYKKLNAITDAIDHFAKVHGRLPCPANIGADYLTDTLHETTNNDGTPGCDNSSVLSGTTKIKGGGVPVASLNLSRDHFIDRFGNRFAYFLTSGMENNASAAAVAGTFDDACAEIPLNSGNPNDPNADEKKLAYLVLSYGKDGHGGYGGNLGGINSGYYSLRNDLGYADSSPAGINAKINGSTWGDGFMVRFLKYGNKESTGEHFDDMLAYREKWQLIDNE